MITHELDIKVSSTYHYPPELLELLTEAIPCLVKSKRAVIDLFLGAGVPDRHLADWADKVHKDRDSVRKHEIARSVLCRINEDGDSALGVRREVVRRISSWEDFSTCYDGDRYKAMGLVARIQKVVEVKDSFTRMSIEREKERNERQAEYKAKAAAKQKQDEERQSVKGLFYRLFGEPDPHKRGKRLEAALNALFKHFGILVKDAFEYKGSAREGVLEQIDGVVELSGHLYLVEMKWWDKPIGKADVASHLVNVYGRGGVGGIFISASGYTPAALESVKTALVQKVCVLCELQEIVMILECGGDLGELLQQKVRAAQMFKEPLHRPVR